VTADTAFPRSRHSPWLLAFLLLLGTGWGLTQSLSKIAVSTGHREFGLIFWQFVICVAVLGLVVLLRRTRIVLSPAALGMTALIALIGTIIPNGISYAAYTHLPAGIMSIVISAVPLLAFPIALIVGNERFSPLRLLGLAFGFIGVLLIVLPGSALPGPTERLWLIFALASPLCYALEGNSVAKWGTGGLDPISLMFVSSFIGLLLVLPVVLATGQWINPVRTYGAPEYALILSSVIHALMYAGYVWLVGLAGPVFAAQTSYFVTGSGVLWAMTLLGERYSGWVWLALAVMLVGLFLVQPRTVAKQAPR
jgi:drug/metabolite transporter (DMT)-like permease